MPPLIASAGTKAAEIFAGLTFRLVLIGLVLAMAFNTYADFRISGPLGIGFHWEGWKPKAKRFEGVIDRFDEAQAEAERLARQAKADKEREYKELADDADERTERAQELALDAAERFIAAGGMRCPADRSGTVSTPAAPGGDRPGGGDGPGPAAELDATGVLVSADDVRICTRNTIRLQQAREWGLELERVNEGD